jgi:hypothetical protein
MQDNFNCGTIEELEKEFGNKLTDKGRQLMKIYKHPGEDIVNAISDLFEPCDFNFRFDNYGYYFSLKNSYDYVSFKNGLSTLMGYMKIAELLGVQDGDEVDRTNYSSGCPTCGYGSEYEVELKFW